MASYEKQVIQAKTFGDGMSSYHMPPEVMVCMECGAVVWPTRVALHDQWHARMNEAAKNAKRDPYAFSEPYDTRRRRR